MQQNTLHNLISAGSLVPISKQIEKTPRQVEISQETGRINNLINSNNNKNNLTHLLVCGKNTEGEAATKKKYATRVGKTKKQFLKGFKGAAGVWKMKIPLTDIET